MVSIFSALNMTARGLMQVNEQVNEALSSSLPGATSLIQEMANNMGEEGI